MKTFFNFGTITCMLTFVCCINSFAFAQQPPEPTAEHKILNKEIGEWTVEIKTWGPGSDEPAVSEGTESNKMLGEIWSVSTFKGNILGMDFAGQGTFGYDQLKKKYVGTWVDSLTPQLMTMEGTYDKESDTMTWLSSMTDPTTGKLQKGKNVIKYDGEDRRVMTMYMEIEGMDEMFKTIEMTYSRKK